MKESGFWRLIKRGMVKHWDASRHEDRSSIGVPDVSYGMGGVNGWIELKWAPRWPKKEGSILRVKVANHQIDFLKKRGSAGGNCFLFLRVGDEFLLFSWRNAELVGRLSREDLSLLCLARWVKTVDWNHLARLISQKPRNLA